MLMSYRKACILILEDEEDWQEILVRSLQHCERTNDDDPFPIEYDIHVAKNSEEALELVKKHSFHVWLLDISMNVNDDKNNEGIEFLRQFVQLGLTRHIAIFVVSAYPSAENMKAVLTDD